SSPAWVMATTWPPPADAAAASATASRAAGSRSTAYTRPSRPTTSASATLTSPPPAPTSTHRQPSRSPSRSSAVASGRRYTSLRRPSSIIASEATGVTRGHAQQLDQGREGLPGGAEVGCLEGEG